MIHLGFFAALVETTANAAVGGSRRETRMYPCQEMFGQDRGAAICTMIEAAIAATCPCKAGAPCPLLSGKLLALDVTRQRARA